MKIAIAADHAGVDLKDQLVVFLRAQNHEVSDLGTQGSASVDYPDYARLVATALTAGKVERGIIVCGSGIGVAMAANRFAGARAAVLRDDFDARMSREHNDANVACLGARVTPFSQAQILVKTWLETPFAGGRHQMRVNKMEIQ